MVRRYERSDRDAVLAVWESSAALAYPSWTPAMFEREWRDIAEQYLPVADTCVFERDGVVLGFISLLGNEVGGLFVAPPYQGQGVGRALMDWACASRDSLELDVLETNAAGRAFYVAYGFRVIATRTDEATGLQVLRLRLSDPAR